MLSILIPTYNYNTFPLVEMLQQQAVELKIDFEILVSDDASTDSDTITKNQAVNTLAHCQYHLNTTNLGRGENRNALSRKAKYPWVLFLDSDTMPTTSTFVKKYIESIGDELSNVFYGGLAYEPSAPKADEMLRWTYGRKREAIPLKKRQRDSYRYTLVSNILMKKTILLAHPFDTSIYDYGYEDFVFIATLKKNNIAISQIDNTVYHLNLEKSTVFLNKQLAAIDNLHVLIARGITEPDEPTLGKWQMRLKPLGLDRLVMALFNVFEPMLKRNIISGKPSILLFDFYKLGYFCALKHS